jgi:hypothetical protein
MVYYLLWPSLWEADGVPLILFSGVDFILAIYCCCCRVMSSNRILWRGGIKGLKNGEKYVCQCKLFIKITLLWSHNMYIITVNFLIQISLLSMESKRDKIAENCWIITLFWSYVCFFSINCLFALSCLALEVSYIHHFFS